MCTACGGAGSNNDSSSILSADSGSSANQLGSEINAGDEVMGTPYVIDDYYIFELSENVERTAVFYTNRLPVCSPL